MNVVDLSPTLCIGIDIGGTHTDAVLLQDDTIVTVIKVRTTEDTTTGIVNAVRLLLAAADLAPEKIDALIIGTTYFVNTVLQSKGLNKVLVVRLAKPASTAISPMADWPQGLSAAIGTLSEIIEGGHEYHGGEIAPLNQQKLAELAQSAKASGITAAAVTGAFSLVNPAHELAAHAILKEHYPALQISLSHLIGRANLLPRENATVLNAALATRFSDFHSGVQKVMQALQLTRAELFFSANDGTLDYPQALFPITTYNSGTSNSISGAATLTQELAAIVADIGGTSTDVGILKNGVPLEAGYETKVGDAAAGIICNFPAPLTRSCGLGGGSKIFTHADGSISIGPDSVANHLENRAIIFGGDILTVTDIAVAQGRLKLGNAQHLIKIDPDLVQKADELLHQKLVSLVEQLLHFAKAAAPIPLILVGGGALLFDQEKLLKLLGNSIKCVIIPTYAAYANAVGAARAKISGSFSGIFQYTATSGFKHTPRAEALAQAKQQAIENAIAKGAAVDTIALQEIIETPVEYMPGNQTRVLLKVIGARNSKRTHSAPAAAS